MTAGLDDTGAVHVRVEGTGANSLLFVHGYCCANDDWDNQVAHFRDRFTCAALDLPGHGRSATPMSADGDAMALAGAAVTRAKHALPGKVVLVGHSMGCKIIREAWRQDEDKIAGLVFVDGSLYVGRREAVVTRARAAIEVPGVAAFLEKLVKDMFPAGSDPALVARVWKRARQLDPGFAEALFLNSVDWDMDQAVQTLREIDVPALAVQCMAFDTSFSWRSMEARDTTPFMDAVRALSPAGDAVVLPGSGHFPMFDKPAELNAILEGFLRRVTAFGPVATAS